MPLRSFSLRPRGAVRRHAAVRKLGPDQHAHPVGDLIVARVGRLDVAPQAIEPELLRLTELVLEKLHRRHGADRIRVIVLVEGGAEIERFAVEIELAAAGLDGAEPEGVLDVVLERVAEQFQADLVEIWVVGRPRLHVLDAELERHRGDAHLGLVDLVDHHLPRGVPHLRSGSVSRP